jgi:hypothetical protein
MITEAERESRKKVLEERTTELTRSAINEANQILDDIAENPEKLTYVLATEFFNRFTFKQDHIIKVYFNYIKDLTTWMQIYRTSKDADSSKNFALKNLKLTQASTEDWIALFESEKDEDILQIAVNKVSENSSSIEDWIEAYKLSSYGTEISKNSLINMKKYAKTHKDWRIIYEVSPFDSKTKNMALEKLMETAQPLEEEEKKNINQKKENMLEMDWKGEYDKVEDFYAKHKDLALINKYIFSDFSAK